ncbi:MAG: radical SAM protein [Acidimicrobiia bacterium]|nr:radical SAM protein [Acidimicrobiia bacterium]
MHVTDARDLVEDLGELPAPSVEAFRWREYGQWSMFTSRGCRYRCSYCSSAAFWRYSIRYHSPEWVRDNFLRLRAFGATDVYIADDTFTQDRKRVYEICELIGDLEMGWSCLTRVDCLDEDLLQVMADAGCKQISFGFESANDETLQIVSKRSRVSRAERTMEECRRVGIRSRTSVIMPLPGERVDDVRNTIDWLERVRPNEVQLYGLTPHDGTSLYDNLEQLGVRILIDDPLRWSRNILDPVCETEQLNRESIRELAMECVERLMAIGYVYLSEDLAVKKLGASGHGGYGISCCAVDWGSPCRNERSREPRGPRELALGCLVCEAQGTTAAAASTGPSTGANRLAVRILSECDIKVDPSATLPAELLGLLSWAVFGTDSLTLLPPEFARGPDSLGSEALGRD